MSEVASAATARVAAVPGGGAALREGGVDLQQPDDRRRPVRPAAGRRLVVGDPPAVGVARREAQDVGAGRGPGGRTPGEGVAAAPQPVRLGGDRAQARVPLARAAVRDHRERHLGGPPEPEVEQRLVASARAAGRDRDEAGAVGRERRRRARVDPPEELDARGRAGAAERPCERDGAERSGAPQEGPPRHAHARHGPARS